MSDVTAVVTTSIYCGPGCSARPNAGNVRRYPLAAAAEAAGYRACLRCRPYRQQPAIDWASNPEVVCRAVRMILAGALDHGTEHELGRRLGVSGRHLRRLFAQHLGVTPDGLARSARTHLARRLLDDSDLSMLEIASVAGFGSVRQLNRACKEIFRMPPRELRDRRRVNDRLVADGGLALRLPSQEPVEFGVVLARLADRAIPGVESVTADRYRRTLLVEGDPAVLELAAGGGDHVVLTLHLPHWGELVHLVDRARRLAGLDDGAWEPFEAAVREIVERDAGRNRATGILARIASSLGTPVPGVRQLGLDFAFPSPVEVAEADLEPLGLSAAGAGALGSFARAVLVGSVRLDDGVGAGELAASATGQLGPETARRLAARVTIGS